MQDDMTPRRHLSPLRLLLVLAAAVFVGETLVMVFLSILPPMPPPVADVLDASFLVLLLFPIFYFLMFRPVNQTVQRLASLDEMRRTNEARLRAMLDNLPYLAWLKDAEGHYLAVNEQFARASGEASPAEVVGKTAVEACPEWMLDRYYDDDQLVMASGKQRHAEMKVHERGQDRWLEVFRNPVLDSGGRVLGIAGFSRDITERRQAEEELRLTAKIFESSHDAIIITDAGSNIISVNPAFTEITGYSQEEAIGKNPRILNSGKQSKEFYAEMWRNLLEAGYWNGEVWNRRKDGGNYAGRLSINTLRDESGKATHYVGVTSDITEYKMAQERVRHLAYYDQLTGLPNGSLMRNRANHLISSSQRERREFSLLFIDLDNFKNVNDSLGHHVGDLLLQSIAGRLRSSVREMDTVARLGGDEFVVLLPDVGPDGAQRVARKIIGQVTNSYGIELYKIAMTTSVGISVFPRDGADVEALLKNAELALYQAKAKGKNDYAFFAEKMNVLAVERLQMENDLRYALLNEELMLYFQPQISLVTRRLVGAEALVRWPHPQLQMVPPDQFIPIAEESDIIIELGEWVMHEACRQLRQWQRQGLQIVPVAVNVSARQMKDQDFPETVSSVLRKTGLESYYLELELTERAVMADMDRTVEMMNRIGELGVKFAVDDFGTGYSSLAYLRHLPLDKLKIDKSFVQDIAVDESDREISNTVIQLAHGLQLSVVAEGVETQQQMAILLSQGCDTAQGYLFGKPMPPHEFAAYLHAARAV
jgi:diguanylate cyclase (GGDEF)-like protein/PAS domain S-box-containing protein